MINFLIRLILYAGVLYMVYQDIPSTWLIVSLTLITMGLELQTYLFKEINYSSKATLQSIAEIKSLVLKKEISE